MFFLLLKCETNPANYRAKIKHGQNHYHYCGHYSTRDECKSAIADFKPFGYSKNDFVITSTV